ncbi:MAG: Ig-like domain-containing protein [Prevotella sp.]|nr:Ig-like domain-containing protein [Prevotella sp.]
MKQYIIKLFCMSFCLYTSLNVVAQQTSMTIDNQSPGWLSSKIGYGDQLTVENLKVTGYLNKDDLLFIARLMKENSLHGKLDLEEANFVSTTGGQNNYLDNDNNIWGESSSSSKPSFKLTYLSLPTTLEDGAKYALGKLDIDTLYLNSITGYAKALSATVRHLVIGENLTVITYPAFSDINNPVIDGEEIYTETIVFPSTLKEIREKSTNKDGVKCRIKDGSNLKCFPNLERLYAEFEIDVMPDSVFLPNIEVLSLDQYYSYKSGKMFKWGMHVFIGENIKLITNMNKATSINLHFASPIPPVMEGSDYYHYQLENNKYYRLYVPVGSADAYRACFKDGGTQVTIIEEAIDVSEVKIDKPEISLNVGETESLSVDVSPEKATDKSVIWTSDNEKVAEVNNKGLVTAKKAGSTIITVSSVSNPEVKDVCSVTVLQPAKSIQLNETSLTMVQEKDITQLVADVSPDDTSDKTVLWSSSDTNVATVDDKGVVTANKAGKATITATAVSNSEVKATCDVTVIQPVTGITLGETSLTIAQLGEMKQLVANVLPEDASNKSVKWTSSNPAVCTVSENGTVVATGYGTATIVATTEDGGFPAACVVNVSQAITITAKNSTKVYGDPNPTFEFVTEGEGLNGVPQITCEATEKSPVGTYPVVITQGSVTNGNVTYVNSTLTVTKAPLTVTAQNSTRSYGEENPAFELKYAGFVNSEDESVLISLPKATTEATASSDAGEYDILVSGGVADNYDFNYVTGKLTVGKASQTLTWEQDFSNVKQYDLVELTATASSGLDVTYTVEGNQICSITKVGDKQYLDCTGEGETVIVAIQEGNKNYLETTKIYKPITIKTATGIVTISSDADVKMYDISGNRISKLQRGINIVKMADGTTKKVVVK